ncbi:MAG: hypothetical protein HZA46_14540 [Planctomycetales bacterium]|nr:hypothetical protein [Planctomycetales bacterium]
MNRFLWRSLAVLVCLCPVDTRVTLAQEEPEPLPWLDEAPAEPFLSELGDIANSKPATNAASSRPSTDLPTDEIVPASGYYPAAESEGMAMSSLRDVATPDIGLAFGFDFVQPSWSNDAFLDMLPGSTAALFPGLTLSRHVEQEFGLAPRFNVKLGFDSEYGLSMAGNFLSLSGSLKQVVGSGADNQSLDANTVVNILTVIAPELTHRDQWNDLGVEWTVGTRYSGINQTFTANLRRGSGEAVTSSSFQDYRGAGLTTSVGLDHPLLTGLSAYGRSRGSLLVGRTSRQSNFAVVLPGGGAGTTSSSLSEEKTDILPVGEFEVGLVWDNRQWSADEELCPDTLMWLKVGYLASVWGDSSLLAAGTSSDFRTGSLLVQGFTLQAGVAR